MRLFHPIDPAHVASLDNLTLLKRLGLWYTFKKVALLLEDEQTALDNIIIIRTEAMKRMKDDKAVPHAAKA